MPFPVMWGVAHARDRLPHHPERVILETRNKIY